MKGTPVGTRGRRRAAAAVAVAALAAPSGAAGSKVVVSNTHGKGKGSFAGAVKRADGDKDLDTIVFSRRLRGTIPIREGTGFKRPVHIVGRGYGQRGSGRFGRVKLRGPRKGAHLFFDSGTASKGSVDRMYLDRVGVASDDAGFSVRRSHLTGRHTVGDVAISPEYAYGDDTRISDSTIVGFRGGVAPYRSATYVNRTTIAGNEEFGVGVGGETGFMEVRNSTIARNSGTGAFGTPSADLRIVNSTISGNRAHGRDLAGGVYGDVSISQSTITGNTGPVGGISPGEYYEIKLSNSIVAGNRSTPPSHSADCFSRSGPGRAGKVRSLGGNLIESPGACAPAATDIFGGPTRLGELRDNGGPTKTHALRKASRANGLAVKKDATKFDQRGVKRGKNPDSGAFERR